MTDEIARESLGTPDNNIRTIGSWGVYEQWIYDILNLHLFFENGILTNWQDSKRFINNNSGK
jgi:hypothetical protein